MLNSLLYFSISAPNNPSPLKVQNGLIREDFLPQKAIRYTVCISACTFGLCVGGVCVSVSVCGVSVSVSVCAFIRLCTYAHK